MAARGGGAHRARWNPLRGILFGMSLAACYAHAPAASPPPAPPGFTIEQDAETVEVYDFLELTIHVATPTSGNPFTDVEVTGTLQEGTGLPFTVQGFCDSEDGSLYRIRFMPRRPLQSSFTVRYAAPADGVLWTASGSFRALPSSRKGIVRVDPDHPYSFEWSGTGEHFFYAGATAYHLLSWTDESKILALFAGMADAGANRIRFLNYGRASDDEWSEGMFQSGAFIWSLSPWPAEYPERELRDGPLHADHTRFNLAHWRKAEHLLQAMRERNVVAAINLYMDRGIAEDYGPNDAPDAGSDEEALYFRYAVARYGAFSNVMWDLGTEHDEYRSSQWASTIGARIKEWDPFDHLLSAHPNVFRPQYLTQPWYDFAEFQYYGVDEDANGSDCLERVNHQIRSWREQVARNGRIIPQVNEEYGYELDPSGYEESPAQVRKKAWAIVMGGGYLTSGQHKAWQHGDPTNGNQEPSDTEILRSTRRMREFFESRGIPYWRMEPMAELDGTGAYGLAATGEHYVVFLPGGGSVALALPPGTFSAEWFRPKTGASSALTGVARGDWQSPSSPAIPPGEQEDGDWVLYLKKTERRSVEFGVPGASSSAGSERDRALAWRDDTGIGWIRPLGPLAFRDRGCALADPRQASFVFTSAERTWEMELENGDYDVTLSVGDCLYSQGPQRVVVEGTRVVDDEPTLAGRFLKRTRRVRVLDGRLSVVIGGGGGTTALNFVEVARAEQQPAFLEAIDFQKHGSPTSPGFVPETGERYDPELGRGFDTNMNGKMRTRGANSDPVLDSLVYADGRSVLYEMNVPNGVYDVQLAVGDSYAEGPHRVLVEGKALFDGETTAANSFITRSAHVAVTDGRLTLELGGTHGITTASYVTVVSARLEDVRVDFQPETSPVVLGYVPDWGAAYAPERGYGWTRNAPAGARARASSADPTLDTFVWVGLPGATWSLDAPSGTYRVTVAVGDALYAQGPQRVSAEGFPLVDGEATAAGEFLVRSACVSVTDGQLTLAVGGLAGNTALGWVRVVATDCP